MGGETGCIISFPGRFGNLAAGLELGMRCLWLLVWSLLLLAWLVVLLLVVVMLLLLLVSWLLSRLLSLSLFAAVAAVTSALGKTHVVIPNERAAIYSSFLHRML